MTMPRWTLLLSALLIALGVGFWLGTGRQSVTALIPTFFGLLILIVQQVLTRVTRPGVNGWVLIVLAALGFIATVSGIPKVVDLMAGTEVVRPSAAISQAVMALISLLYGLGMIVVVRRDRSAQAS